MVFEEPKYRVNWLPLVELWYNNSYHFSLKTTPFDALYGYKPPQMTIYDSAQMVAQFRTNNEQAQSRMKYFTNMKKE